MAIKHIKDGEDFNSSHFPKDFGFSSSAEEPHSGVAMDTDMGKDDAEHGPQPNDTIVSGPRHAGATNKTGFARGGHIHPHGHEVSEVVQHHDGTVVHHHAHGGYTMHHPDGNVTHHDMQGRHLAHGGAMHRGMENMHDSESEFAHRPRGGAMEEGSGEPGVDHLRGGGSKTRIPRQMMPAANKMHTPIGNAPPERKISPRNAMPKGQMGYGMEPSAEPDMAGADQVGNSGPGNMPPDGGMGMARGGHRRRGGSF